MTRSGEITNEDRPLIDALSRLRARPGTVLKDKVFDRYIPALGPIGPCFVVTSHAGVRHVFLSADFDDDPDSLVSNYAATFGRPVILSDEEPDRFTKALHAGTRRGPRLDLSPLSAFERAVLEKTQEIPPGEVRPYSWIAAEIGAPRAVRAVGTALARNPVPFIVPCHRVVKSDGLIGNYGFGPPSKAKILSDEGVDLDGYSTLGAVHARLIGSDTTHVVCYPTCHAARRITPRHRETFASLAQAQAQGFRPCQKCRPI